MTIIIHFIEQGILAGLSSIGDTYLVSIGYYENNLGGKKIAGIFNGLQCLQRPLRSMVT